MIREGMRRNLSHGSSNALDNFQHFQQSVRRRKPVVLLDYDGTLTPIVRDPNRALLSSKMRALLTQLSTVYTTGVISGRSLDKITHLVSVKDLIYAGSHGFDICGPAGLRHQAALDYLPLLSEIRDNFERAIQDIPGASVEDNRFSITVHYRNVESYDIERVAAVVQREIVKYPDLRLSEGKMVFEVKPNIQWNKGKAVEWLLEVLGLAHRDDIYTIYIGDDTTDEDVFEVFGDECEGIGIAVTDERKWTGASMVLRDPDEVYEFLSQLLQLGLTHGYRPETPGGDVMDEPESAPSSSASSL